MGIEVLDFEDLEGGETPNANGLAYIILPGINSGDGSCWIGQFSANPYKLIEPNVEAMQDADGEEKRSHQQQDPQCVAKAIKHMS